MSVLQYYHRSYDSMAADRLNGTCIEHATRTGNVTQVELLSYICTNEFPYMEWNGMGCRLALLTAVEFKKQMDIVASTLPCKDTYDGSYGFEDIYHDT